MIVVGLTGSIAMGKSDTLKMFAELGVPVFDADAEVHALYETGGDAVPAIAAAFPGVVQDGRVDRAILSRIITEDPAKLAQLEAIVHPLVHECQRRFIEAAKLAGAKLVVLDIPLLFETGGEMRVDKIVVVSAPAAEQRRRALARPGMSDEKLARILARQMSDDEKRQRADFVVDTGAGHDRARAQVHAIVNALEEEAVHARDRS
jgi:dephospho-CoA kinase